MKTLAKNGNNDIYIYAGSFAMADGKECERIIVDSVLKTQKREMQFDEKKGIDYFGTVFESPSKLEQWAVMARSAVSKLSFVKSIEEFEYSFDQKAQTINWHMRIKDKSESVFDVHPFEMKDLGNDAEFGADWDDLIDKPENLENALRDLEKMHKAMEECGRLNREDTMVRVNETINRTIIEPLTEN